MPKRLVGLLLPGAKYSELRQKANARRDRKEHKAAALLYSEALRLMPEDGPIHVQCGHMFKESGDLSSAGKHYEAALRLMPEDADLSLQYGHFLKVSGRRAEALAAYRRAVRLMPGWPEAVMEYVNLAASFGNHLPPDDSANVVVNGADLKHLFNDGFYHQQSGITSGGYAHYRETGWKLGLDPHPLFSTKHYVRCLGRPVVGDPLEDFGRLGMAELAEVHPLLDVKRYNRLCPPAAAGLHPLVHYLWNLGRDGVDGFRLFDTSFYLEQCPGLMEVGFPPLVHYLQFGWKEGRRPHRAFTPAVFRGLADLRDEVEPFTLMVAHFLEAQRSRKDAAVRNSVIILNLSKSVLTLQCVYVLNRFTEMAGTEVIIFDNGSMPAEFQVLCTYATNCRILRSEVNVGFGEANNLAAESAIGENLIFLNNDAFVSRDWLPPLLDAIERPEVGAAGPMFIYPDGRLQEAGATVTADGQVHQRGRGLLDIAPRYRVAQEVDYLSAATMLIRADLFRQIMGFDLIWDPAYYEDVDLCLKVRLAGRQVRYEPGSLVRHMENSTSADAGLNLQLHTVVNTNRVKFTHRWGDYLDTGLAADAPDVLAVSPAPRTERQRPLLALFTPYPLTPGGGERYLLSFAHVLREEFDCVLYTPQPTSRLRIDTMGRELGLQLDHVRCVEWRHAAAQQRPDVFVSIGNEVLPLAAGCGHRSFFICQFPFPMQAENFRRDWGNVGTYDGVILYSDFVRTYYEQASAALGLASEPVTLISPPVAPVPGARGAPGGITRILNVGRFNPGGHCKRQDVMIEAFRALLAAGHRDAELHLAGSLGGDAPSRVYLAELQEAAKGLPVHFHVNSSLRQLHELFLRADVYWHATGINDRVALHPERFEHFGITILEAMSAGAIPVTLGVGGPGEIITDGSDGYLISGRQDLVDATVRIMAMPPGEQAKLRERARATASRYSEQHFKRKILQLFGMDATA